MNRYGAAGVLAAASLVGCTGDQLAPSEASPTHSPNVAGAGYTTFDTIRGGCQNGVNPNGINCNTYTGKDAVYLAGGPDHPTDGLSNGTYFFAVLTPGSQLAGFLEGDIGGDPVSNRMFVVEDHEVVSYAGTHAIGETSHGDLAIGLSPFDDTDDPGGLYILAICAAGATDPSQCKYDAFRIRGEDVADPRPLPQFPIVQGGTYYDADLDGRWDVGEPGIPSWKIDYHDTISGTVETGADGLFTLELIPDGYLFVAREATNTTVLADGATAPGWLSTGHALGEVTIEGDAYVNLNADKSLWLEIDEDQVVHGVYFGMVCTDARGSVQASPATCPAATF